MKPALVSLVAFFLLACGHPASSEGAVTSAVVEPHPRTPRAAPPFSGWKTSYRAGMLDVAGHPVGGTELRFLVPFQGKLFAGIGRWEDSSARDPSTPGAEVLVKDREDAPWRVDLELDDRLRGGRRAGERRYHTIGGLEPVTLTTDGIGAGLTTPAEVLVASPWSPGPGVLVAVRGTDAVWRRTELSPVHGSARSFGTHVDRRTRVSRVFAGTDRGIFTGTYDARVGSIDWNTAAEAWRDSPEGEWRVMAFGECDGSLFATVGTSIYEREDGPSPRWKRVYTASFPPGANIKGSGGLRGMTSIASPDGTGHVLLVAVEGTAAKMLRVDPGHGFSATDEEDVVGLLSRTWQTRVESVLLAYNHIDKITDPRSGEEVLLIGLQSKLEEGAPAPFPLWGRRRPAGATYLIRRANGHYEVHSIEEGSGASPPRVAVRTLAVSPFAPGFLYAGGFDADKQPVHDTAWALEASVETALDSSRR